MGLRDQLDSLRQDARFAARMLRRSPGFALTAIVTLTLAIGANTAVFGLVRAVLLRPLPYHEPDRVVRVETGYPKPDGGHTRGILTGDWILDIRAHAESVRDLAVEHLYDPELSSPVDLLSSERAERLRGGLVTPNFFETLGVRAAVGRTFGSGDSDADPLAVISDGYWRREFGADPGVVGRPVDLLFVGRREPAPRRFIIAGVLPPRFRFTYPRETEIWAMLPWSAVQPDGRLQFRAVARLALGATAEQSQAELTGIVAGQRPGGRHVALVTPLSDLATAESRPGMYLLAAVAGVVLLIACANIVLLLVARVAERGPEVALRTALGAGRGRIARQLVVEAAVLVALGGAGGVGLAYVLQPVLRALVPAAVTRADELSVDLPVLAFSAALCAVVTLVAGLAPLWAAMAGSVHDRLKQANWQMSAHRDRALWRRGIVAVQVAVVLVLLVGAALLSRSLWELRHVDLGYGGNDLLTMEINAYGPQLSVEEWARTHREFTRELLARVRALPGVDRAGVSTSVPMRGVDYTYVVGPVGGRSMPANMRAVDPEFFALMGIRVLAGRGFTERDTGESAPVAVVSSAYARQAFGDQSPLGRQLDMRENDPTIVGVVEDVRYQDVRQPPKPAFYLSRDQKPGPVSCLLVRTRHDRTATAAAIRTIVRDLAPTQPMERVTTVGAIVDGTIAGDWFHTVATGAFAAIGLVLAAVGLIGVVRRGVTERTRELAIRSALGADAGGLVRRTVLQELRPVLAGVLLGLLAAFWQSRLLRALPVRGVGRRSVGIRRRVPPARDRGAGRLLLPGKAHYTDRPGHGPARRVARLRVVRPRVPSLDDARPSTWLRAR